MDAIEVKLEPLFELRTFLVTIMHQLALICVALQLSALEISLNVLKSSLIAELIISPHDRDFIVFFAYILVLPIY